MRGEQDVAREIALIILMKEKLELLQRMLSPDFDWDQSTYNGSIEDLFKECYIWHSYKKQGNRPIGTLECGSASFKNTPKAMYRLFYLLCPEEVDFSAMYKSGTLVEVCSPDYNFGASFQFYKYELGVYFHYAEEFHNKKHNPIIAGWPGADNGQRCTSEIGNLWFETLIKCLNHKHHVYPGNNFVV